MEFLGIGPLELFFILIIALIILGPGDMVKAGRTLGRLLRKVVTSPEWHTVQKASRELKYLPNRLMREASLEDLSKDFADVNKIGNDLNKDIKQAQSDLSSWTTPPELILGDKPAPNMITDPAIDHLPEVIPAPVPETKSDVTQPQVPDPAPGVTPTPALDTENKAD